MYNVIYLGVHMGSVILFITSKQIDKWELSQKKIKMVETENINSRCFPLFYPETV